MRRSGVLRHVDEVIVPRLARGFARMTGRGRMRKQVIIATGLLATAATLVTVALASHRREPVPDLAGGRSTVHVGVAQGQSIPGYVSTSRDELQSLVQRAPLAPQEIYALVSFRSYLAPGRLTPALGGVSVAEVYARVPLAQAYTQIVRIPAFRIPDDVVTGMAQVAARKEAEARDLHRLAAKLSAANAAEDRLRSTYLGEAELATAEAGAYRGTCTCVYAAVVRATPVALEQIAARPEVRAVDPAPEVLRLDQAVFLAPLPEQPATMEPGSTPTPSGVASPTPVPAPSRSPSPSPTPTAVPPPPTPSRSIEPLR